MAPPKPKMTLDRIVDWIFGEAEVTSRKFDRAGRESQTVVGRLLDWLFGVRMTPEERQVAKATQPPSQLNLLFLILYVAWLSFTALCILNAIDRLPPAYFPIWFRSWLERYGFLTQSTTAVVLPLVRYRIERWYRHRAVLSVKDPR